MDSGMRPETIEECAGRHLARAFTYGSAWNADMTPVDVQNFDGDGLNVARRGRLLDGAGKSIRGGTRVRQFREWQAVTAPIAIPTVRPDFLALAALSFAQLSEAGEAILLVYAGQYDQWPKVERAMIAAGHTRIAAADAMNRILWRRPDTTLGRRAFLLSKRKEDYLAEVQAARSDLKDMLHDAATRFLSALGNRKHPADSIRDEGGNSRRIAELPRRRRAGQCTATIFE